ncbi:MAG TPA: hypothetical protein VJN18_11090 [Polyangiaceae bacterium]|nr:hypothetical protein [Polyangiaceae bacterium]
MRTWTIAGVRVRVMRVHALAGFQGKPYVCQVADMMIVDSGPNGRPKRFAQPEHVPAHAQRAVRELLALRAALERAWFGE